MRLPLNGCLRRSRPHPAELLDAAAALENRYDFENRGIMLLRIEDKLQLASRPMYGPYGAPRDRIAQTACAVACGA